MIDFDNLDRMISEKYISVQKHPEFDLYIYNYTQRAQFDRVWNNETLQCRGLIMDGQRNIVSRPFRKFFNLGELQGKEIDIPAEDFVATEKMDGSLGISYFGPDGEVFIATRGSFVSDQAKKANLMLNEYKKYYGKDAGLNPDFTYLFEIIYPDNRIVVDYGDMSDLVLIALINTKTGEEIPYHYVKYGAIELGFPVVQQYDGITDFDKIEQKPNSEGYVIHFPSSGLRFKVKFDEYVRLHKIITGINAKRIWEFLKAGQPLDDILDRVPDEFYKWVSDTTNDLYIKFNQICDKAIRVHLKVKDLHTRKEQALALMSEEPVIRSVVFNMLDKKSYDQIIWKVLEPEFERPFKVEVE